MAFLQFDGIAWLDEHQAELDDELYAKPSMWRSTGPYAGAPAMQIEATRAQLNQNLRRSALATAIKRQCPVCRRKNAMARSSVGLYCMYCVREDQPVCSECRMQWLPEPWRPPKSDCDECRREYHRRWYRQSQLKHLEFASLPGTIEKRLYSCQEVRTFHDIAVLGGVLPLTHPLTTEPGVIYSIQIDYTLGHAVWRRVD